jgi:hypothetical protein
MIVSSLYFREIGPTVSWRSSLGSVRVSQARKHRQGLLCFGQLDDARRTRASTAARPCISRLKGLTTEEINLSAILATTGASLNPAPPAVLRHETEALDNWCDVSGKRQLAVLRLWLSRVS